DRAHRCSPASISGVLSLELERCLRPAPASRPAPAEPACNVFPARFLARVLPGRDCAENFHPEIAALFCGSLRLVNLQVFEFCQLENRDRADCKEQNRFLARDKRQVLPLLDLASKASIPIAAR